MSPFVPPTSPLVPAPSPLEAPAPSVQDETFQEELSAASRTDSATEDQPLDRTPESRSEDRAKDPHVDQPEDSPAVTAQEQPAEPSVEPAAELDGAIGDGVVNPVADVVLESAAVDPIDASLVSAATTEESTAPVAGTPLPKASESVEGETAPDKPIPATLATPNQKPTPQAETTSETNEATETLLQADNPTAAGSDTPSPILEAAVEGSISVAAQAVVAPAIAVETVPPTSAATKRVPDAKNPETTESTETESTEVEAVVDTVSSKPQPGTKSPVVNPVTPLVQEQETDTQDAPLRNVPGPLEAAPLGRASVNAPTTEARPEQVARPVSESAPTIDPSRFVNRVSRAFEAAQQRGGGPIAIRLSPPELGSLQVRLEVKEGILTASVETETQTARNALLENLPALRERLAEQQIRVEKFDVEVRDDSNRSDQQPTDAGRDQHEARSGERDTNSQEPKPLAHEPAESSRPATTIHFPEDRINLVA